MRWFCRSLRAEVLDFDEDEEGMRERKWDLQEVRPARTLSQERVAEGEGISELIMRLYVDDGVAAKDGVGGVSVK